MLLRPAGLVMACSLLPRLGSCDRHQELERRSPPSFIDASPIGSNRFMYVVSTIAISSAFNVGIHGCFSAHHPVLQRGSYETANIIPGYSNVLAHTNPEAAILGWARSWTATRRLRQSAGVTVQIFALSLSPDDRILASLEDDTVIFSSYCSPCRTQAWSSSVVHFYGRLPTLADYAAYTDPAVVRSALLRLQWYARRYSYAARLADLPPIRSAPIGGNLCQCSPRYDVSRQLDSLAAMGPAILNALHPTAEQAMEEIFCDHLETHSDYDRCRDVAARVAQGRFGIQPRIGPVEQAVAGPSHLDRPATQGPVTPLKETPDPAGAVPALPRPISPPEPPVIPRPITGSLTPRPITGSVLPRPIAGPLRPAGSRNLSPMVPLPRPIAPRPPLRELNPYAPFPAPPIPTVDLTDAMPGPTAPQATPVFEVPSPAAPVAPNLGPIPHAQHRERPLPYPLAPPRTQTSSTRSTHGLDGLDHAPFPIPDLRQSTTAGYVTVPDASQRELENELQQIACQEIDTDADVFQGVWDVLRPFMGMAVELLQQHFPNMDQAALLTLSQGSCFPFHQHRMHKRSDGELLDYASLTVNATVCESLAVSIAGKVSNLPPEIESRLREPVLDVLEAPQNCVHFKSLHVRIELGYSNIYFIEGAGTNDDIFITVGKQTIKLLSSPWYGSVANKPVNLTQAFGTEVISLDQFTGFRLFPQRSPKMPPGGDPFNLKSLIFSARCVEQPHREAVVDKHSLVNKNIWRLRWPSEFSDDISVHDWHFSPYDTKADTLAVSLPGRPNACTYLKALKVRLTLDGLWQSWFSGGTSDNVYLSVGMENKPSRGLLPLTQSPSAGSDFTAEFDLDKFFGQKTVPVSAILSYVNLYATPGAGHSPNDTDSWKIKSIIFDGQCSDNNKTVRANIIFPQGKWVERRAGKEWGMVYSHDKMGLDRWIRVD
ncbi:hypothetical protein XA68_10769 [Ophiocordyceps unilateralis]|uniref:Uncharacterized protein n=1 Tax=Ophiocordyceps unilateralis TaxID=268505 RepID=A0A2A9PH81_OPHUN|nr:hypothetical protein XA68_10769 [Ophiocordyceps unilateralis]